MTPKEKAKELYDNFYELYPEQDAQFIAKECALIAVDEILETLDSPPIKTGNESHMLWKATVDYWKELKQEIEKI